MWYLQSHEISNLFLLTTQTSFILETLSDFLESFMPLGTEKDPFLGKGIIFLKWFTLSKSF